MISIYISFVLVSSLSDKSKGNSLQLGMIAIPAFFILAPIIMTAVATSLTYI